MIHAVVACNHLALPYAVSAVSGSKGNCITFLHVRYSCRHSTVQIKANFCSECLAGWNANNTCNLQRYFSNAMACRLPGPLNTQQ